MAYITKAMLIEDNKRLRRLNTDLARKIEIQNEQIDFFKKFTPGGYCSAMAIALEKVTEAVAHVITDLKTIRR